MLSSLPADDAFQSRAFSVRDAVAQGVGKGTFAHSRWHAPFHGVRSRIGPAETLLELALQYLPRLRNDEHFSHATALALLGCPIHVPFDAPVDVSSPVERGRVVCRGVIGHRHGAGAETYPCRPPEADVPVPVSAPLRAVLQSALQLPFPELVIALDYLLLADPARFDRLLHISVEQLDQFARSATGKGSVRFREAATLARPGAESRMESLMRLSGVAVGMPPLRLQMNLRDGAGKWIGRFDAVDEETLSIFEFDGGQHLFSRRQRMRDARKLQHARDAGWRVRVFYAEEVLRDPLTVGSEMLRFSGRTARPPRKSLVRLILERSGSGTHSAVVHTVSGGK